MAKKVARKKVVPKKKATKKKAVKKAPTKKKAAKKKVPTSPPEKTEEQPKPTKKKKVGGRPRGYTYTDAYKKLNGITDEPKERKSNAGRKPAGRTEEQERRDLADSHERQKEAAAKHKEKASAAKRDIGPLPTHQIDWDLRLACQNNFKLFNEEYLSSIFYLGWSDDQLRVIDRIQYVMLNDELYCIAMPRAGGKTALCRGGTLWGTVYGKRKFPFLIGSKEKKAAQSLDAIKANLYANKKLRRDFPEICYPIEKIENRPHLAPGQTYNGELTHIIWQSLEIRLPTVLLSREDAEPYLQHDPDSLIWLEDWDAYISVAAGSFIRVAGIDGSIRGEAETHPILLTQPRPDLILPDDIQKDQKADSPESCSKLVKLIDGAIMGLAGPDKDIAGLMPCTVTREGDVSDTYLDSTLKPEWRGERYSLVTSWPDGITDYDITLDTEAGKCWNKYGDLRKQSLKLHGDIRLATDYYETNRAIMDGTREGDTPFLVSWKDRKTSKTVSPQQHAMELRFRNPTTFAAEYQNKPRSILEGGTSIITPAQLAERTLAYPRLHIPLDGLHTVAHIDVQEEITFWTVLSVNPKFSGVVAAYGTWPELTTMYFRKSQTLGWSLLTNSFFKEYPEHKDKAFYTKGGKLRAPQEAKIYYALTCVYRYLRSLKLVRCDEHETPVAITRLGIDGGSYTDVVKRFVRELGDPTVMVTMGQSVPPTHKQYEEYQRNDTEIYEDYKHPTLKEVKWIHKPSPSGDYYLSMDVDRLKSFLMNRLSAPMGSPGSIALHKDTADRHEMYTNHVLDSEYPEAVTAKGITKDMWQEKPEKPDNDWLDNLVACMALASYDGASLHIEGQAEQPETAQRRQQSLRQIYEAKRGNR